MKEVQIEKIVAVSSVMGEITEIVMTVDMRKDIQMKGAPVTLPIVILIPRNHGEGAILKKRLYKGRDESLPF
jgi:hypothetical protein